MSPFTVQAEIATFISLYTKTLKSLEAEKNLCNYLLFSCPESSFKMASSLGVRRNQRVAKLFSYLWEYLRSIYMRLRVKVYEKVALDIIPMR